MFYEPDASAWPVLADLQEKDPGRKSVDFVISVVGEQKSWREYVAPIGAQNPHPSQANLEAWSNEKLAKERSVP
jgi:hypothetical protein